MYNIKYEYNRIPATNELRQKKKCECDLNNINKKKK